MSRRQVRIELYRVYRFLPQCRPVPEAVHTSRNPGQAPIILSMAVPAIRLSQLSSAIVRRWNFALLGGKVILRTAPDEAPQLV